MSANNLDKREKALTKNVSSQEQLNDADTVHHQKQAETDVKNAHASGMGALERSDESIENVDKQNLKKDDTVY